MEVTKIKTSIAGTFLNFLNLSVNYTQVVHKWAMSRIFMQNDPQLGVGYAWR